MWEEEQSINLESSLPVIPSPHTHTLCLPSHLLIIFKNSSQVSLPLVPIGLTKTFCFGLKGRRLLSIHLPEEFAGGKKRMYINRISIVILSSVHAVQSSVNMCNNSISSFGLQAKARIILKSGGNAKALSH